MYYYIVDPTPNSNAARIAQRLQELITPMGISGEISVANPARSAEELTYMGIDKGYTTIVAVGGEQLANTIATILLNESREKIAFGVIPLNAGALLPQMLGVANNDMRAGAEMIKRRHLDLVDMVQIGTKQFMLTEAFIVASRRLQITIEVDQMYKVEVEADYAHLSNDLVLTVQSQQSPGLMQRTLSMMGLNHKESHTASQFHGKQIRMMAHEPLPIVIAGHVVAKTPTTFTRIPAALKLITSRAILPQKGISDLRSTTPSGEPIANDLN